MAEKNKLGRKTKPDSQKKKPFVLYFSDEEIERAGGAEKVRIKFAKVVFGSRG